MAKELCASCSAKLAGPEALCPRCGSPTRYATDADRLQWDLGKWRAHLERSAEADLNAAPPAAATRLAERPAVRTVEAPVAEPIRTAEVSRVADLAVEVERTRLRRRPSIPKLHLPRLRLPRLRSGAEEPEDIVLDVDNPFAYRACATCGARDWIVRTTRNEDGTYNYWCVRCSRSFKSELRLRHAIKPFLSGGAVVGGITALSLLMR